MKVKHSPGANKRRFGHLAAKFLEKTEHQALQGINPGGIYQAIWCRDASYILMDWFLSGNIHGTLQQIYQIWSHQITSSSREKIVYGRGSIDMKFLSEIYNDKKGKFKGALPTTIYQAGFSEVYGQNPDIDSTALMISSTSWILARCLRGKNSARKSSDSLDYFSNLLLKVGITDPAKVTDFVIPKMFDAVEYLKARDIDNDGLLEQSHNEDWMDTILRAGKIVYSQACWILALTNFAKLLSSVNKINQSRKITTLVERAINAVDKILWSEEDRSYLDMQEEHHLGARYRTLMQDVSLYLIAAKGQLFTNDTKRENIKYTNKMDVESSQRIQFRSIMTLDTIKS
ncbi:MAG TPA: GH116 family glycosyl hydrolase, partial [Nitrososphaeraceae archaeon]|nr:GH116 family glycosyl hydrolase [Nitrososphaeraceae archaeon]